MGGAFCRNARTDAVEGQQTAYVNLWDSLAHGHWPGADGRFGGGEADAHTLGTPSSSRSLPVLHVQVWLRNCVEAQRYAPMRFVNSTPWSGSEM